MYTHEQIAQVVRLIATQRNAIVAADTTCAYEADVLRLDEALDTIAETLGLRVPDSWTNGNPIREIELPPQ